MAQAVESEHATDLKSGPFSVLYKAVQGNTQILVNVRNNHKLLGRVKAYDRHMNLWVLCVVIVCCVCKAWFLHHALIFEKQTLGRRQRNVDGNIQGRQGQDTWDSRQ